MGVAGGENFEPCDQRGVSEGVDTADMVRDRQGVVHRQSLRFTQVQTGYPLHRENRENVPKNPCQGKHREFGNLPKHRENTGNLVCSSRKFPES